MGCDIHLYVEKKVDDVWISVDKWTGNNTGDGRMTVECDDEFYNGRNYDLFAILADVRNGRGFAGCYTGEGFNPIAATRGLPEDVCEAVKAEYDAWDGDGHSHSYFTVEELLKYDWTQKTKKSGWVSSLEFYVWDRWSRSKGEGPNSYSGGIGGPKVEKVSIEEMEARMKSLDLPTGQDEAKEIIREKMCHVYCQVEWEVQYSHECNQFWVDTIPKLLHVGKPEDVRIVFWFDN